SSSAAGRACCTTSGRCTSSGFSSSSRTSSCRACRTNCSAERLAFPGVESRVLVYAEALDVAAEGAVWYARRVGDGSFDALHVAGKNTDSGIYARWFEFTGGSPRLDVRPAGTDAQQAVLAE